MIRFVEVVAHTVSTGGREGLDRALVSLVSACAGVGSVRGGGEAAGGLGGSEREVCLVHATAAITAADDRTAAAGAALVTITAVDSTVQSWQSKQRRSSTVATTTTSTTDGQQRAQKGQSESSVGAAHPGLLQQPRQLHSRVSTRTVQALQRLDSKKYIT